MSVFAHRWRMTAAAAPLARIACAPRPVERRPLDAIDAVFRAAPDHDHEPTRRAVPEPAHES